MNDKGRYPASSPDGSGRINWCGTADNPESQPCEWGEPFTDPGTSDSEKTVYMSALPKEPVSNQNYYYEGVTIDGKVKGYRLYGKLENTNDPDRSGPYGIGGVKCKTEGDMTCNYVLTSDTVAPPPVCSVSGSACMGPSDTTCCPPISCILQYEYNAGYTGNCTPRNLCGLQTGYTTDIGGADGISCSADNECCSNVCTPFYAFDGSRYTSCTPEPYCGGTKSGYTTTPPKADGRSCSVASECCSNACTGFYIDNDHDSIGDNCTPIPLCGITAPDGYAATCCKTHNQACSYDSECCDGKCCAGKCGSSCCWSADGTTCDTECKTGMITSADVYSNCTQGSQCAGTGCWTYGGVCEPQCTGSGYVASTVSRSCCTEAVWKCGYIPACTINNVSPSTKRGCNNVTAYELTGSCQAGMGNCYFLSGTTYTTHYSESGYCPAGFPAAGLPFCSGMACQTSSINKKSTLNECSWVGTTFPYTVSSQVTKYTGTGTCSSSGSGQCYKLTGGGTYYTGSGPICPTGGNCPSGTYYDQTTCQYIARP